MFTLTWSRKAARAAKVPMAAVLLAVIGHLPLWGQEHPLPLPAKPLPIPFTLLPETNPLAAPPELLPIMRCATTQDRGTRARLQKILDIIFRPESDGGLGITYDNSRTRTVSEVLRERKANCISLTALYIASCNLVDIPAHFAEPMNLNRWTRDGRIIRMERHVVAVIPMFPQADLVADFLPQLRQRQGAYLVKILSAERTLALFHSNRAVELLSADHVDEALREADIAVKADPTSNVSWNIRGAVYKGAGELELAESDYLTALGLDAKDTAAIGNMEALLRETGRTAEALHYRQLGLELRQKDPYFQAFLAEEAMEAQQWDEAATRVAAAIKLLPSESSFYLLKARLDLVEGQPQKALAALELARKWAVPGERERYDNKIALLKKS